MEAAVPQTPHIRTTHLQFWHRQKHPDRRLICKSLLQIHTIKLLASTEYHHSSITHSRLARIQLDLVIGDRLFTDLDKSQAVVVLMVPLLGNRTGLKPISRRGLEMLPAKKHPFRPHKQQIAHKS